ncbi:hypothetical protein LTR86_006044 [Recurvomyces mirabilis]|nr:hypothetical protein LTR86_006044 [Recurvomyces mirabilis]
MLKMTMEFQNRVILPETGSSSPFLLEGLPAAQAHPALWHAWLASSIATLAPKDSLYWQHKGLQHHQLALRGLRKRVLLSSPDQEWRHGTMLMLHIYQLHSPAHEHGGELYIAHLTAAHELFGEKIYYTPPNGRHAALLLEAYILRTAINYIFQPQWNLPQSHVRSRLTLLRMSLEDGSTPEHVCPWIGPVTFRLIEIVFELSWLAHRLPLSTYYLSKIVSMRDEVEWLHLATVQSGSSPFSSMENPAIVRGAYTYACAYLCTVLIEISSLDSVGLNGSRYLALGHELIHLALGRKDDAFPDTIFWPVAILGTGACSQEEQNIYRSALEQLERTSGREAVSRVASMLTDIWTTRNDSSQRGHSAHILKQVITRYRVFL